MDGFDLRGLEWSVVRFKKFHNMDIKGSVGPREIKSVHQLLCTPPWSLQLPTT